MRIAELLARAERGEFVQDELVAVIREAQFLGHPSRALGVRQSARERLAVKAGSGWVGVDLDGTLMEYDQWEGLFHFGQPIAPTVEFVRSLLSVGHDVRIVTGRARRAELDGAFPRFEEAVMLWTEKHLGRALPLAAKDHKMIALLDDRAIQIESNTGRLVEELCPL